MDGWMDIWIHGMGVGRSFVSFFISKNFFFFCTFVCSPYVGSVFYCMSLFGGRTVTFHCNLMDTVQTTFSLCLLVVSSLLALLGLDNVLCYVLFGMHCTRISNGIRYISLPFSHPFLSWVVEFYNNTFYGIFRYYTL